MNYDYGTMNKPYLRGRLQIISKLLGLAFGGDRTFLCFASGGWTTALSDEDCCERWEHIMYYVLIRSLIIE